MHDRARAAGSADHSSAWWCQSHDASQHTRSDPHGAVGLVAVSECCASRLEQQHKARPGVQVTASSREVSSETVMVIASARKKLPVTPVTTTSGRNTTTGVIVEKTSGREISCKRLAHRFDAAFAGFAVEHDVLHDDDGVVDHEADGRGQSAQRHQVEAFADEPEHQHRDGNGDRNHQAGDDR